MSYARDILNYEHELKDAGVPENQAIIHARRFADLIDGTMVTKEHFDSKIQSLEIKIDSKIQSIEDKFDSKIQSIEVKIETLATKEDIHKIRIEFYRLFIGSMSGMIVISGIMQTVFHFWK
jgi:hypothetical protein